MLGSMSLQSPHEIIRLFPDPLNFRLDFHVKPFMCVFLGGKVTKVLEAPLSGPVPRISELQLYSCRLKSLYSRTNEGGDTFYCLGATEGSNLAASPTSEQSRFGSF